MANIKKPAGKGGKSYMAIKSRGSKKTPRKKGG